MLYVTARRALLAAAALCTLACDRPESLSEQLTGDDWGEIKAPTTTPPADAGYQAVSPHWPHIRVQVSDYRIGYQSDAVRAAEYPWSAQHFDLVTLDYADSRSVAEYRALNPGAKLVRYAMNWTMVKPGQESPTVAVAYYAHMQAWYAKHPEYAIESAFLHDATLCAAGSAPTEACRLTHHIWTQDRWVVNPGDAGLRAYQRARLAELAADADGVFLDEHSGPEIYDALAKYTIVEYRDLAVYMKDLVAEVAGIRAGLGAKLLNLNTAEYTSEWDAQLVLAAGGAHGEGLNNALSSEMEKRWSFIERVTAGGARLEMLPGTRTPAEYTAGNSPSAEARRRLFELTSYYLVRPASIEQLVFNPGVRWDQPFQGQWLKAIDTDVGTPAAPRRVVAEGTDPSGTAYRVWGREYDNAVVVARPVIEWSAQQAYDDGTKVTVSLPAGDAYLPLQADGTIGAPCHSIELRASEAAILLKQSRLTTP
jgi:hypothetical protein